MTDPHDLIRRRRYLSEGFVANEKIHLSKLGKRARSQKNMRDTYTVIHLFVLAYTDSIPQPRNCCSVYGECLGKTDGFARCDRFTAAAIRTLERANIDEMCSPHHLQAPRLASRDPQEQCCMYECLVAVGQCVLRIAGIGCPLTRFHPILGIKNNGGRQRPVLGCPICPIRWYPHYSRSLCGYLHPPSPSREWLMVPPTDVIDCTT